MFYVDATGQHGLIATMADLPGAPFTWYNGTYFMTNATADGLYAGAKNTEVTVATQTDVGLVCGTATVPSYCTGGTGTATGNYAALAAANYSVSADGTTPCAAKSAGVAYTPLSPPQDCYSDWYLPSEYELSLLFLEKATVGSVSFTFNYYWSSTQQDTYYTWFVRFTDGVQNYYMTHNTLGVRAIRAF